MPLDSTQMIFTVEGTFTEKPILKLNGSQVSYDRMYISHRPAFTWTDYDNKEIEEPEYTCLEFSLKAKEGALEADIMYRVKANEDGNLVLVESDEAEAGKNYPSKKKSQKKEEKVDDKKIKNRKEFKKELALRLSELKFDND